LISVIHGEELPVIDLPLIVVPDAPLRLITLAVVNTRFANEVVGEVTGVVVGEVTGVVVGEVTGVVVGEVTGVVVGEVTGVVVGEVTGVVVGEVTGVVVGEVTGVVVGEVTGPVTGVVVVVSFDFLTLTSVIYFDELFLSRLLTFVKVAVVALSPGV
jgi:hypothetical protein